MVTDVAACRLLDRCRANRSPRVAGSSVAIASRFQGDARSAGDAEGADEVSQDPDQPGEVSRGRLPPSRPPAQDRRRLSEDDQGHGRDRHRRDLQHGRRIRPDLRPQHEGRRAVPRSDPSFRQARLRRDQRAWLVGEDRRGARARLPGRRRRAEDQQGTRPRPARTRTAPTSRPTTSGSIRSGRCARSTTSRS